jgi:peroxiredoxin
MKHPWVMILAAAASTLFAAADTSSILQPGTAAPGFSLPTLTGTREVLSVYCGAQLSKPYVNNLHHIVILSFWATYCKPCQKEIPELHAFAEKHQKDSVKIFCVSIDKEGVDIVAPFVKEKNYTLPVLLDPYKATAQRYGVKSLPSLFVIGPDGAIRYSSTGFDEKTNLDEKLESMLAGVRQGRSVQADAVQSAGASVLVKQDAPAFTAKQKWHAVAQVECGESPEKIAQDLKVSPDDIKAWYNDLKKTAQSLWESK